MANANSPVEPAAAGSAPPVVWLYMAICVLIWGSSFILMKRGLEVFSPLQVAALRLVSAGICLGPYGAYILWRKGWGRPWGRLAISGLTGSLVPAFLFPLGQTRLDSSTSGVLNSLTPISTLIVGSLFFSQPLRRRQAAGVTLGFAGACVLALLKPGTGAEADYRYAIFPMLATICYGINVNFVKRYLTGITALELAALSLGMISLPGFLYLALDDSFWALLRQTPGAWDALGYVAALGAFGTAFALLFFWQILQHASALVASSVTYLIPVVALLWGAGDGEALGWPHLAGFAAILGGVLLIRERSRR